MSDAYITKGADFNARCVLAGLRSADSSLHPFWAKAQYQGFRTAINHRQPIRQTPRS